jgi:hypothetical protein
VAASENAGSRAWPGSAPRRIDSRRDTAGSEGSTPTDISPLPAPRSSSDFVIIERIAAFGVYEDRSSGDPRPRPLFRVTLAWCGRRAAVDVTSRELIDPVAMRASAIDAGLFTSSRAWLQWDGEVGAAQLEPVGAA